MPMPSCQTILIRSPLRRQRYSLLPPKKGVIEVIQCGTGGRGHPVVHFRDARRYEADQPAPRLRNGFAAGERRIRTLVSPCLLTLSVPAPKKSGPYRNAASPAGRAARDRRPSGEVGAVGQQIEDRDLHGATSVAARLWRRLPRNRSSAVATAATSMKPQALRKIVGGRRPTANK